MPNPLYDEVRCPKNNITIVSLGQSNSANYVNKKLSSFPNNLIQYDWTTRKCFIYKEPLLGADGRGGAVITYTAMLLSSMTSHYVIVSNLGVGGSYIYDWAEGGIATKYLIALHHMKSDGLNVRVFFFHQGESDSARIVNTVNGTNQKSYYRHLNTVIKISRKFYPDSLFGVALVSICRDNIIEFQPVRNAQYLAANTIKNSFISGDSDKIQGVHNRYDSCHFSGPGAYSLGNIYFKSYSNKLFTNR